jgi:hypothetical protein
MLKDADIKRIYDTLADYHSRYLQSHGVRLPALRDSRGNYIRDALVLVYLAQGYPNTKSVTKEELTEFIRHFYPNTADVQQARHLAMQKGWYIVSGTRHNSHLEPGEYQLLSLEKPYPAYRVRRREGIPHSDFENLKRQYNFRCATCGSKEGESTFQYPRVRAKLTQAHMNPQKPLESGNILPQCEMCNRAYRNYWIFDNRGRVLAVSNPKIILQSPEDVQLKVYQLLHKKFKR